MKKILVMQLVVFLAFFASFNISTAQAEEVQTLAICDHNGDKSRNLSDVSLFASCVETFDANGDGAHDLQDIALYSANNQSDTWCGTNFDCVAIPKTKEISSSVQELAICDHNGDKSRNLSDVSYFASCAETFDANDDGVHDLSDLSSYTSNNQDSTWCRDSFICDPNDPGKTLQAEEISSSVQELAICDHNGDKSRNLSDVSYFASCAETFDANGDGAHDLTDVSLYSENNQDNNWCSTTFVCDPSDPAKTPQSAGGSGSGTILATPPEVSGVNAQVSCNQVDITWSTSKDSLTWIVYGLVDEAGNEYKSETYKSSGVFSTYSLNHNFSLSDLAAGTSYNYVIKTMSPAGKGLSSEKFTFTTLTAEECGLVLGEKIVAEETEENTEVCSYLQPDQDVLGQTEWADGTLLRGCGPEVYIIENQTKRHINSLSELFNYIGQRIYNVTNDILDLF
ncbi:hypothetical protein C4566_00045 [Candidatus Parcubacteria bacterium]|nr:MAG: hypothetical protein C4566_00045 [Candidatus Parcubacteria bacterium]